jgi:predicted Zn-dependent peptidase
MNRTSLFALSLVAALVGACKKAPRVDPLDRPIGVRATIQSGVLDSGVRWIVDEQKGAPIAIRVAGRLGWAAEGDAVGAAGRIAGALGEPGAPVDVRMDRFEVELPVDRRLDGPVAIEKAFDRLASWACCLAASELPTTGTAFRPDWPDLPLADDTLRAQLGTQPSAASNTGIASLWSEQARPDGLVVAVTGDVRAKTVRTLLDRALREWEAAEGPVDRPSLEVADAPGVWVSKGSGVELWLPVDAPLVSTRGSTVRALRRGLLAEVAIEALRSRLRAVSPQAELSVRSIGPNESALVIALAQQGELSGARRTLKDLLVELRRVEQWGILNSEIRSAERVIADRGALGPEGRPALLAHVLDGVPLPAAEREALLRDGLLRTFTSEEISDWTRARIVGPRVWAVPLDASTTQQLDRESRSLETAPPVDRGTLERLVEAPEVAPAVFEDGVATLDNGMTVRKVPMDGPLVIRAVRKGGLAGFADGDRLAVRLALATLEQGASGDHAAADVTRFLAQLGVQLRASVHEQHTAISGLVHDPSDPEAVRAAFELLHLRFRSAQLDEARFEAVVEDTRLALARERQDPLQRFERAWNAAVWPDDAARIPPDNPALDAVEVGTARVAVDALFGDPADWTVVLAGALPDDIDTLIATWLGSLTASESDRSVRVRDRSVRPITPTSVDEVFGDHGLGYARIAWFGEAPDALSGLEAVFEDHLRLRLTERLRPERPGLYGLDVDVSRWGAAGDRVQVQVAISGHPERLDALLSDALKVVEGVRTAPAPSERMFAALREQAAARATPSGLARADALAREALGRSQPDAPFPEDPDAFATWLESVSGVLDPKRRAVGRLSAEPDAPRSPAPPSWSDVQERRDMLNDPPTLDESADPE